MPNSRIKGQIGEMSHLHWSACVVYRRESKWPCADETERAICRTYTDRTNRIRYKLSDTHIYRPTNVYDLQPEHKRFVIRLVSVYFRYSEYFFTSVYRIGLRTCAAFATKSIAACVRCNNYQVFYDITPYDQHAVTGNIHGQQACDGMTAAGCHTQVSHLMS